MSDANLIINNIREGNERRLPSKRKVLSIEPIKKDLIKLIENLNNETI
ncbi:MAG: hypothetical protein ACFFCY_09980 [Promethearchaeota archaeon]